MSLAKWLRREIQDVSCGCQVVKRLLPLRAPYDQPNTSHGNRNGLDLVVQQQQQQQQQQLQNCSWTMDTIRDMQSINTRINRLQQFSTMDKSTRFDSPHIIQNSMYYKCPTMSLFASEIQVARDTFPELYGHFPQWPVLPAVLTLEAMYHHALALIVCASDYQNHDENQDQTENERKQKSASVTLRNARFRAIVNEGSVLSLFAAMPTSGLGMEVANSHAQKFTVSTYACVSVSGPLPEESNRKTNISPAKDIAAEADFVIHLR